jgi:hypothetical protein
MEQAKPLRFEVQNPDRSEEWQPSMEIDENQLRAAQELVYDLNKINAPVRLRIARNSD